jgi:geranylgeranyl pyrophosphate synthase
MAVLNGHAPSHEEADEARAILERLGAREYTRARAQAYRDEALAQLEAAQVVSGEALERLRLIVVSAISA